MELALGIDILTGSCPVPIGYVAGILGREEERKMDRKRVFRCQIGSQTMSSTDPVT